MDSYNYNEKETVREVRSIKATSYQKHYHPDEQGGICVVRRKDESVEDLIKRFRKKYSKSGLAKELRDRMHYEKPSQKRRRKRMQAIRLAKSEEKKQQELQEKYDQFKSSPQQKYMKRKEM